MGIPDSLLKKPVWFYVRLNARPLAVGLGFLLITNMLDAAWPLLLKRALDEIEKGLTLSQIGRTCLIFFAVMASLSLTRYGWRQGFGRFHTLIGEDLRNRAFRHMMSLSSDFFLKKPVGDLMSTLTSDVQVFRRSIGSGFITLTDSAMLVAILIPIMLELNAGWTWRCLIVLPLIPVLIWFTMKRIQAAVKLRQQSTAEVTAECEETVQGVRVLKGFALEDRWLERFSAVSERARQVANKVARIDSVFFPIMELGVTSGTVLFLFVAKDDVLSGAVTLGTFVAFHRYIMKMVWPTMALGEGLSQFSRGQAAFERVHEILVETPSVRDDGRLKLERVDTIEFKNVSFRYPGAAAETLHGLSFRFNRGEVLGLLGPVGTGKTTLVNLLARLFDPTDGEILVNGRRLQDYTLESVRRTFHLIPQDVFLFSDSVLQNIGFAKEADLTEPQADVYAEKVQIKKEVDDLPERYASVLGEKGVNLSGGQKQRLTLARGFASESGMLILDDVLCSVDTKTEQRIASELVSMKTQGATFWIISHRLSTLACADKLLVLNGGRVESFGEAREVLERSATLQTIRMLQEESHEDGLA